ncbi:TonB-dependent receptor [Sphingosinicella rhizophila]|uniref:TonB-dependent receptor n=1 Tax=Sphingosinicella rhizophila TaxID=3050082 RepID=A0ABU3Q9U5_9SPHN|nr:TonB-dependent receptor [Sphingosinicella sp. GR2756]MDT9599710.1 TonB-dependent receptor [Sphingosinicella sp. GR2756]
MFRFAPFILLSCLSSAAAAQPVEIVVTGRDLGQGLGEEVYDTLLIDRERLVGSASNRLEDILRDAAGFQTFRRSDARSANPTSQGATLRGLGGNASSRALLLLDGVPQTDPFGGWISWPAFDPRRLGEIRVTRGGGSGVHGPGALAGTIALSSAAPADMKGLYASLAYGSRDSVDAFAAAGLSLGRSFLTLSGSHAAGDGFVPIVAGQRGSADRPAPYSQSSLGGRLVTPIADMVELQANALWFSDERERGTAFTDIQTKGTDASLRLVGEGAWRWSAVAYVQKRDFYNSFASVDDLRTVATQVAEQYDVPSTGLGARFELRPPLGRELELRLGGDWRRTDGETRELYSFAGGQATRRRVAGGETGNFGAFAELARENEALTLTLGGRIDRWSIRNGFIVERIIATGAALADMDFADRSGWQPTARAGLAWRPRPDLSVRGAAYLGWRLPTLNELYRPFRVGADATAANAALDPERLRGLDVGLDYRPASWARIGATLFVNELRDAIANVTLGEGPGQFPGVGFVGSGGQYRQRRNLDGISSGGVELDMQLSSGAWALTAAYSYVDAKVEAGGDAIALDGLPPAQTPRHNFSTAISWRTEGRSVALTARYAASQFEDDLGEQIIPDALTFDAAATWPVTDKLAVEFRAENLANTRVVAGISGSGIIERATPRTLWIGLRFKDRD